MIVQAPSNKEIVQTLETRTTQMTIRRMSQVASHKEISQTSWTQQTQLAHKCVGKGLHTSTVSHMFAGSNMKNGLKKFQAALRRHRMLHRHKLGQQTGCDNATPYLSSKHG